MSSRTPTRLSGVLSTPEAQLALAALRSDPAYSLAWSDPEPLVSVRIATIDNAEILVERALASVLAQTYERWEAVVVGDDVRDDTRARIRALRDPRIRYLNLPVRGPYPEEPQIRRLVAGTHPANVGLRHARGRWIAPLDHDDSWAPGHIEDLLERARESGAEVAYGRLRYHDVQRGADLPLSIGAYPPVLSEFAFQAALVHGHLKVFEYDIEAHLFGEPGDWNLARRLLDAGVRFAFADSVVGSYFFDAPVGPRRDWLEGRLSEVAA